MAKARYLDGLSLQATEMLRIWGDNIRQARKSRGWNQEDASQRFLMSKHTLIRVEGGDPTVGVGAYLAAMDTMSLLAGVDSLAASYRDAETRGF